MKSEPVICMAALVAAPCTGAMQHLKAVTKPETFKCKVPRQDLLPRSSLWGPYKELTQMSQCQIRSLERLVVAIGPDKIHHGSWLKLLLPTWGKSKGPEL